MPFTTGSPVWGGNYLKIVKEGVWGLLQEVIATAKKMAYAH